MNLGPSVSRHEEAPINVPCIKIKFQSCGRTSSGEMKKDNLDGHHQINHFHLESFYGKENAEILGKASEIAHTAPGLAGGKKYYNNNDIQSDYFDVAYYVSISVGKWNKEYEIKEAA